MPSSRPGAPANLRRSRNKFQASCRNPEQKAQLEAGISQAAQVLSMPNASKAEVLREVMHHFFRTYKQ